MHHKQTQLLVYMLLYVKSPINLRYFSHKMLLMNVWATLPQCTATLVCQVADPHFATGDSRIFVFLDHYFACWTDQCVLTELYQSPGFGKNQLFRALVSCFWTNHLAVSQSIYLKVLNGTLVTINMHYINTTLHILNSFFLLVIF